MSKEIKQKLAGVGAFLCVVLIPVYGYSGAETAVREISPLLSLILVAMDAIAIICLTLYATRREEFGVIRSIDELDDMDDK